MFIIKEYLDNKGNSPFQSWFNKLSVHAASKVTIALTRLENGNLSNVKSLKGGVFEIKINYGPGFRIYYGLEGRKIIILLCGGTKKNQQKDINKAKDLWKIYKGL